MGLLKSVAAEAPPTQRKRKVVDGGLLVLAGATVTAGLGVLVMRGPARVLEIVLDTFGFLLLLAPKIGAGIFIAASLPLVLPRDKVASWIGTGSGLQGLVLAMLAGLAIPGGPMMTFPLAAGILTAGADIGAVIAFITGWSLLGLNRTLIWEFSFLPPEIVWTRYLVSLPLPILCGYIARVLWLRRRQA